MAESQISAEAASSEVTKSSIVSKLTLKNHPRARKVVAATAAGAAVLGGVFLLGRKSTEDGTETTEDSDGEFTLVATDIPSEA